MNPKKLGKFVFFNVFFGALLWNILAEEPKDEKTTSFKKWPFLFSAMISKSVFKFQDPIELSVTMENISTTTIYLQLYPEIADLEVDGTAIKCWRCPPDLSIVPKRGDDDLDEIKPGEICSKTFNIRELYFNECFWKPGNYRVRIKVCGISDEAISKTVRFKIIAPEPFWPFTILPPIRRQAKGREILAPLSFPKTYDACGVV